MTKLQRSDRCRLINSVELGQAGIGRLHGREVILLKPLKGGWDFFCTTDPDATQWWAPDMCFQLEQQQERKKTDEMRTGDRAILCDTEALRSVGLVSYMGKKVTLASQRHDGSWNFTLDSERSVNYWAPARCFNTALVAQSHYRAGDRCRLIDKVALSRACMSCQLDKMCTLVRQMSQAETDDRPNMRQYCPGELGWWIKIDGQESYGDYYCPERCLLLVQPVTECGDSRSQLNKQDIALLQELERDETQTQKETSNMYLFNITIIKTPNALAQQAGEIDTIIVSQDQVMAKDANSAICLVAAKNAEAIVAEGKSQLRVVVSQGL